MGRPKKSQSPIIEVSLETELILSMVQNPQVFKGNANEIPIILKMARLFLDEMEKAAAVELANSLGDGQPSA